MTRTTTSVVPLDVLERTVVAAVALTARALAEVAPRLTFVQWRVLVVADTPDGVPVGQIAAALGSKMAAMSRLVRRMQARGLVETRPDLADGRVVLVSLSTSGRDLRSRVLEYRRAELGAAVLRLGLSDETWLSVDRLAAGIEAAGQAGASDRRGVFDLES